MANSQRTKSELDHIKSMALGSQNLMAALYREHPRIVRMLVAKNGEGDGCYA